MSLLFAVTIVSGALILGALWGLYGPFNDRIEGFLLAMAGGALIVALVNEMVRPAIEAASLTHAMGGVAMGALVFTFVDYLIDEKLEPEAGTGLLAAITLDGIPENLALGISFIDGSALGISALAGAILLSNLPEAAGGTRQMRNRGIRRDRALLLWTGAAALLAASALAGYWWLERVEPTTLAMFQGFSAGAVIASLATEIFPRSFKIGRHFTGIAVAIGLILAETLSHLG